MAMKTWMSWCLTSVMVASLGCRSTGKRDTDLASELAAADFSSAQQPASPWETQTFVHQAKFQEGTGPIDAGDLPAFTATDSGLRYRVLRHSSGKIPTANNTVSVNYRGWLNSGKVFDSSYERNKPTTFPLDGVIPGWTEGLQLVGEGGMIELWIPSQLGYGERGSKGSIPPHSHLHFIVELIDVN